MRRSTALVIAAIIAIFCAFLPMIVAHAASWVADLAGCDFNQGLATRCIIMSRNWGPDLLYLAMAHWLILITFLYLPLAMALVLWAWIIRRKARVDAAHDPRTGALFWVVCMVGFCAPWFPRVAAILLAIAVLIHWRERRAWPSGQ